MVLIDTSIRWSYACLLLSRDLVFARLLAQMIKLRAQFPEYTIKKFVLIILVNLNLKHLIIIVYGSIQITIEHHVTYVHTQIGLVDHSLNFSN